MNRKTNSPKHIARASAPPVTPGARGARIRGKYAAAFKQGVRVIVHTKTGDQERLLKRDADGGVVWKYPPVKSGGA